MEIIDEEQFISYFENLAIDNKQLNHEVDGKKSFFYIETADDLNAFDDALRSSASSPAFLLVAEDGELNDNGSENHTQDLNGQFYVVAQISKNRSIRQARALCLPIAVDFLTKMKRDAKKHLIFPGHLVTFTIDKIPYQKVGPMREDWYGYAIWFTFTCPFGYTVNSGSWRSIP